MSRTGRPLGEVAEQCLRLASTQSVTYLDIAAQLQLSRRDASLAVYRMAQRGHLIEERRVLVNGARKPVPMYRAACESADPCPNVLVIDWPPR
jgi:hypothetical protein